MKVAMKRKRAYFFAMAITFTCFLTHFHANGEPKAEPMSQLLDNINDDTSSSTNKNMLQKDKNKYYGIPSMNDANHRGNSGFGAGREGDLLTAACVNARRRFNADSTLMHNLMEFYNANRNLSSANCINQKTKELQNCDLSYKWNKLHILNHECRRGHGKTCFETLKITTTTPRRGDQYGMYIQRKIITSTVN